MSVTVTKSSSASILKTKSSKTGLKSDVTVKKVKSQSKTKVVAAEDTTEAPPTKKGKVCQECRPEKRLWEGSEDCYKTDATVTSLERGRRQFC